MENTGLYNIALLNKMPREYPMGRANSMTMYADHWKLEGLGALDKVIHMGQQ